jgi:UPF0755 protein
MDSRQNPRELRPHSAAPKRSGRTAGSGRQKAHLSQQPSRRAVPSRQAAQQPASAGPLQRRPRSENRWFRAIVMVMATVVGCIFLALFILQSAYDLFGLNQKDKIVEVTIPDGAKISDVAKILKKDGVVDQPLTFRMYLQFKDVKNESIVPGDYIFNANMSYNELISALSSGYTEQEVVRITFIEGMTMLEIATQLEEARVCDAKAFMDYLDQEAEYAYEFFGAIEDDPLRFHKLEGYLFPDTYDFYIGENVESVARKFIRNFNDKLTPDLKNRMQDLNFTIDETITLASIIQKEAGQSDDMRLVSSVFHNRLNDSGTYPNLQSDVTIFYVEENIKPLLQMANQAMYDAYNTYVREGLPVGPICNPGLDAIQAALYPEKTSFYYFVTDKNMDFYYAQTADAHYRNVYAAQQVGGTAHGIDTQ